MVFSNLIRAGFLSLLLTGPVQASTAFFNPSQYILMGSELPQDDVVGILTQAAIVWRTYLTQLLDEYSSGTLIIKQSGPTTYSVFRSGGDLIVIEWEG